MTSSAESIYYPGMMVGTKRRKVWGNDLVACSNEIIARWRKCCFPWIIISVKEKDDDKLEKCQLLRCLIDVKPNSQGLGSAALCFLFLFLPTFWSRKNQRKQNWCELPAEKEWLFVVKHFDVLCDLILNTGVSKCFEVGSS